MPAPRISSAEASAKTVHRRSSELQDIRETISRDSQSQFQAEVKAITKEERQKLLTSAGITIDIPPEQGVAMKADLAIPWNKLRIIRRYSKYMHHTSHKTLLLHLTDGLQNGM